MEARSIAHLNLLMDHDVAVVSLFICLKCGAHGIIRNMHGKNYLSMFVTPRTCDENGQ